MDLPNELLNMAFNRNNSNNDNKLPEDKNDHELNLDDRMHLISKNIEDHKTIQLYQNLSNSKEITNYNHKSIIQEYVYNDIEFLQDHYLDSKKSLFQKINNCHTKIGSILLQKIIMNPIEDINNLKLRQEYLSKINKVYKTLEVHMSNIKLIENDLIWFWDDQNNRHVDLMNDMVYFNWNVIPFFDVGESLNNNESALLVSNIYKILISPILTALTPIISLIVPLVIMLYFNRKTGNNLDWKTIVLNYFKTLWNGDSMKLLFKSPTQAALASLASKGLYLFMYFQNIYYSIQSSSNTNKIINIIHDKLNKMNLYIKHSLQINKICESIGLTNISCYLDYNNYHNDINHYNLNYFVHGVFNTSPGLFTNKGKILKVFKNFKLDKLNLINLFNYNGVIDALLSINKLLINSTKNNPYCLSTYLSSNKPKLNFNDIWHPYLTQDISDNVVKNSIDIDTNILVTGPNAAGKSTFIKSIIINIILSQTIGVNSATKFSVTPYHLIETYLHIPDCKGSSSLFEAEMIRSKEYIEKLKDLEKNQFSFIVLDEIFSSTNYVEGFSGAYAILKNLSNYNNAKFIVTSHYSDLEILESNTKGKIKNYKFEIHHDKNNQIIFNYELKKGISRQYIALELLDKNGFDKSIINDALEICSSIKDKKNILKKKTKKKNIVKTITKINSE